METKIVRKIVIENFYGEGIHLYEDQLGWQENERREAKSNVSKKIFWTEVVEIGWDISFYSLDEDLFWGIHTEEEPIVVKALPRNREEQYIFDQCEGDTHDEGEVIATFENREDIWDNLRINDKSLEELIQRSLILQFG